LAAYFVAIREAVHDRGELQKYGELAGKSAEGHPITVRASYGHFRMTEGAPIEGAVILEFPTFQEAEAWYDSAAYQVAAAHRFRGAKYLTFILQGVD
jgi:uncharacterized protein (DUF1330 family)